MVRIRKLSGSTAIGAAMVLALSACGGLSSGTAAGDLDSMDPLTITYTSIAPAEHPMGKSAQAFARTVHEKSGGKITVELYFSGALMPGEETLSGVASGVAQAGYLVPSYFRQELPINNWLLNMGSMPSTSYPHGMLSGSAALMELQSTQEDLQREWADHNIKVIWAGQVDVGFSLLCTKPIKNLAEARGLRVRNGGGAWIKELEALGMVPVQMPTLEVYEGLQRGVVDCFAGTPQTFISYGLWDVAKYFVPVSMSALNGNIQGMNLDTWKSLPPDAQAVITEAAQEWWAADRTETLASFAQFATEGPSRHGVTFLDPSPLDAVLEQHQADVIRGLAQAAPATVSNPQGFIDAYKALLDEWMEKTVTALGTPQSPRNAAAIQESYASALEIDYAAFNKVAASELFAVPQPSGTTAPR